MFIELSEEAIAEARNDLWREVISEDVGDEVSSAGEKEGEPVQDSEETETSEDTLENVEDDAIPSFLTPGGDYRHPEFSVTPFEQIITPYADAMTPLPYFEDPEVQRTPFLAEPGLETPSDNLGGWNAGTADAQLCGLVALPSQEYEQMDFAPVHIPSSHEWVSDDELWSLPDDLDAPAAGLWMQSSNEWAQPEDLYFFPEFADAEPMELCDVPHIFIDNADTGLLADYSFEQMFPGLSRPVPQQDDDIKNDRDDEGIALNVAEKDKAKAKRKKANRNSAIIGGGSLLKPQLIHITRGKRASSELETWMEKKAKFKAEYKQEEASDSIFHQVFKFVLPIVAEEYYGPFTLDPEYEQAIRDADLKTLFPPTQYPAAHELDTRPPTPNASIDSHLDTDDSLSPTLAEEYSLWLKWSEKENEAVITTKAPKDLPGVVAWSLWPGVKNDLSYTLPVEHKPT